jgi:hypothetical protein
MHQSSNGESTQRTVIVDSCTMLSAWLSPPMTACLSPGSMAPTVALGSNDVGEDERHLPSMGSHTLSSPPWQSEQSASKRSKRHEATHMTGAECPRSMTRGERRRDAAAACSSSSSSPGPSSTPQRQTWPVLEPLTRAARGSDVTQMQVTSWRGGAGQAAIGTSSDSCGSAAAGGLGSRLIVVRCRCRALAAEFRCERRYEHLPLQCEVRRVGRRPAGHIGAHFLRG